jgi:hypothetical protein
VPLSLERSGKQRALPSGAIQSRITQLRVRFYEPTKTGELFFERAIQSRRGKDYITDAELQKLKSKAENIARRLYGDVGVFNDKDAG